MALTPKECGITNAHITAIQQIASKNKCFIFSRLVNRLSTGLIEEGYGTKKLDIHAKSSDWGPQAGFICEDSQLSKVVDESAEKIKRNEHAVHETRHAKGVGKVQLAISKKRAEELATDWDLFSYPGENKRFEARSKKGAGHAFFCLGPQTDKDGKFLVSYSSTKDGPLKPLMVLGYTTKSGSVKAVTADYDLFAICPHFSAPGVTVSTVARVRNRNMDGVLSGFQSHIKNQINLRCGSADVSVVNHGTELNNPYPENEPEIAMFPPGGNSRIVKRAFLPQIFGDLCIRGFHVYVNKLWHTVFQTQIGVKMSRLRNPALRATLKLEHLDKGDFANLSLAGYGGEKSLSLAMERFGHDFGDNSAQSTRPRWQ